MTGTTKGKVYLIGAGPGDVGLITVRGLRILQKADVVLYDHLASSLLLNEVPKGCTLKDVGKNPGKHNIEQKSINEELIYCASHFKIVVRLKGGDPFVFGRGSEEILVLQNNKIPYEVIPGVTSAIAAPCSLGLPITERGISYGFSVYTSYTKELSLPDIEWEHILKNQTVVFLMVVGNLQKIIQKLLISGHDGSIPASIIESGTLPQKRRIFGNLDSICELARSNNIKSPAVLVVGQLAAKDVLCHYDVLSDCRIAVVGTQFFTNKSSHIFRDLGASVEEIPNLKIRPLPLSETSISYIKSSTWLIFTSSNGVKSFWNELLTEEIDIRSIFKAKIAAIGSGTAGCLKSLGIIPDFIPHKYTGYNLGKELINQLNVEDQVSIIRAEHGSQDLVNLFNKSRVNFQDVAIYDVDDDSRFIDYYSAHSDLFDYIIFGSSSGVISFFKNGGTVGRFTKLVCIGPSTEKTLREKINEHLKYDIDNLIYVAEEFSIEGITKIIVDDWRIKSNEK